MEKSFYWKKIQKKFNFFLKIRKQNSKEFENLMENCLTEKNFKIFEKFQKKFQKISNFF